MRLRRGAWDLTCLLVNAMYIKCTHTLHLMFTNIHFQNIQCLLQWLGIRSLLSAGRSDCKNAQSRAACWAICELDYQQCLLPQILPQVTYLGFSGIQLALLLIYGQTVSCICGSGYCSWVFFNQGSAGPKGCMIICQGFHHWPVKNNLQNHTVTPDNAIEILFS